MLPARNQVQSNNDEKQKSNNDNMDQAEQQQSVQSVLNILEEQPSNNNANTIVGKGHNNISFLSKLISTIKDLPVVWDITIKPRLKSRFTKTVMKKIQLHNYIRKYFFHT